MPEMHNFPEWFATAGGLMVRAHTEIKQNEQFDPRVLYAK
jgi:hypothetical protein